MDSSTLDALGPPQQQSQQDLSWGRQQQDDLSWGRQQQDVLGVLPEVNPTRAPAIGPWNQQDMLTRHRDDRIGAQARLDQTEDEFWHDIFDCDEEEE